MYTSYYSILIQYNIYHRKLKPASNILPTQPIIKHKYLSYTQYNALTNSINSLEKRKSILPAIDEKIPSSFSLFTRKRIYIYLIIT